MATDTPVPPLPPGSPRRCSLDGRVSELVFTEPQAPLLLRAGGCASVDRSPSGFPSCVSLVGADGTSIVLGAGEPCFEAFTPLGKPARSYRGPHGPVLEGLEWGDVGADVVMVRGKRLLRCRLYGYCASVAEAEGPRSRLELRLVAPRLVYPCALAPCRTRVARGTIELRVPWICVRRGSGYTILVCTEGLCRIVVGSDGVVEAEPPVIAFSAPTCSYPVLSRLTVLGGHGFTPKPRLIDFIGAPVPVAVTASAEGSRLAVTTALWNPLRIGTAVTLRLKGYRVKSCRAWSPLTGWEEVEPLGNTVRLHVRGLSLVYAVVEAVKTLL